MPVEPAADEWIEWNPPRPGKDVGEARLSKRAVDFVLELLHVVRVKDGLRKTEHDCLDEHEARGLIRQ